MKKQFLTIFSSTLILFFSFSVIAHAGCPLNVEDTYIIDNLECSGDCENLLILNRNYPSTVYYQDDCVYCDSLRLVFEESYGRMTMYPIADFKGDYASRKIYQAGEEISSSTLWLTEEYWNDKYEIQFRNRAFSIQFSPHSNVESGFIESVECSGNCENIKVFEVIGEIGSDEEDFSKKITRYNSCPEVNLCSAVTIYNHPSCGGGYDLNLAFTGLDEEHYPKERAYPDIPLFSSEELAQGPIELETNFDDFSLKYQLVNDPEERQRRTGEDLSPSLKKQFTSLSQENVVISVVLFISLTSIVYLFIQKKHK